jgi:hypothetical protein
MRIKSNPIRSIASDTYSLLPDVGSNYCAEDLILNTLPNPNNDLSNEMDDEDTLEDYDASAAMEFQQPQSQQQQMHTQIVDDLADIEDAILFISIAIQCEGAASNSLPPQKTLQKMGLHTSRQRRAREFLRRTGILRGNLRTYLTDSFDSLGSVSQYLQSIAQGVPAG